MSRFVLLLVLALFPVVFGGCAANDAPSRARHGLPLAERTEVEVRYNPAPCQCPPYEVRVADAWTRAFVAVESTTALDELADGPPLETRNVIGRFAREKKAAGNGVAYPVLTD